MGNSPVTSMLHPAREVLALAISTENSCSDNFASLVFHNSSPACKPMLICGLRAL